MDSESEFTRGDAEPEAVGSEVVGEGECGAITPSGGDTGAIESGHSTRLRRRVKRAHKLEELKWKSLDADRYLPRAIELLRAIALGEDDQGNPVGADRLQLEALKDYLDMVLGDLPSFTEKVLRDDFVASVFEAAATAIRSAFSDVEDFDARMRQCAETFRRIVISSGMVDT